MQMKDMEKFHNTITNISPTAFYVLKKKSVGGHETILCIYLSMKLSFTWL